MTSQPPDDGLDPFETRLAARVRRHAEHGVRPFDAGEITRNAAATGSPRGAGPAGVVARLGWMLAGAILTAALIGGGMFAAGGGLFPATVASPSPSLVAVAPTATPSQPAPTPVVATLPPTAPPTLAPTPEPPAACDVAHLSARLTAWSGAAGSRIASVTLVNQGAVACLLAVEERAQLVDGHGSVLINGTAPSHPSTIEVAAGGTVSTDIEAANYCGGNPVAPVTVAFQFEGGDRLVADAYSPTDTSGIPPCNGSTLPGSITMHPWAH